ncbi:Sec-independent protein translocase subunit TatA [Microtetraspora malaysiensis]|uniref:Sec-independent protein translocase subunit TatA n=1 Tax=Microtetraspora malaysiensis TaxID=161358 RepID=UPI003D90B3A4
MGGLSPMHWMIVAIAAVLLFGAKKLPDTARSVGKSLRIFKTEVTRSDQEEPQAPPTLPSVEEQARQLEQQAAALRAQAAADAKDKPVDAKDKPAAS